jgi:hypothetical protein
LASSAGALLALMLALGLANSAGAANRVVVAGPLGPAEFLNGPVSAGGITAWALPVANGPGFQLYAATFAGDVVRLGGPISATALSISLSPSGRIAYGLDNIFVNCSGGDCRFATEDLLAEELYVLPPLGTPQRVVGCHKGEAGCPTFPCAFEHPRYAPSLNDDALLYVDRCFSAPTFAPAAVVKDLSGGRPDRVITGVYSARLADPFVAVARPAPPAGGSSAVAVYNRLSGEEVYEVPAAGPPTYGPEVQSDGKVAFAQTDAYVPAPGTRSIVWASPADPTPHHLALGGNADIRLHDDLIAFRVIDARPGVRTFGVKNLSGATLRLAHVSDATGGWDFDGRYLTFARQPCTVVSIVTWDFAELAPPPGPGLCPATSLRTKGVRATKKGEFSVRLRCPGNPQLGCPGTLRLTTSRLAARRGTTGLYVLAPRIDITVQPGETKAIPVKLAPRMLKLLRTHRRLRVTATTIARRPLEGRTRADEGVRRGRFTLLAPR